MCAIKEPASDFDGIFICDGSAHRCEIPWRITNTCPHGILLKCIHDDGRTAEHAVPSNQSLTDTESVYVQYLGDV